MTAAAPKEIETLVADFERDQNFYKSREFNETELRTRFINPLIAALGWDVYHDQPGRADQHEVKEEDSVEVEGKIKNPDYSFRLFDGSLGSMKRKFFMEVKRPSVNIESGAYPAFQLRRYAWSADLPISILTDFEELSVYYCLSRPDREDKPAKSRIMYLRYDQYIERWPEIAALFSREAVLGGSLDRFARSLPQKRGEKRVDAALLDDISKWRETLAKNIAIRNPELDTASLNYSVQAIIDRIMFLRICEDRGIERYMRLRDLLEGERVYARLFELFQQADERYNSGIFHFKAESGRERPDAITPGLKIDDSTLKEIIKQLYFPHSPYAFSVLPAEILGQIYEQFLGQVIRLDADHNAQVEDKPEVKKAGGVKYTPAYIVEAIEKDTGADPGRKDALAGGPDQRAGPGLRIRLISHCGLSVSSGLAQGLVCAASAATAGEGLQALIFGDPAAASVRPGGAAGPEGPEGPEDGDGAAGLSGQGWGVAALHGGAEEDPAQQYLRGGHRQAGGGGDKAVTAAESAGGRER